MKGGFVIHNGKFHPENEFLFSDKEVNPLNNAVKQSFRAENNEVLFIEENYDNLIELISAMSVPLPEEWDIFRFRKDVSRLLNKNHYFLAAKVTIYFYTGYKSNSTDYFLTAEEIPKGFYPLNETGLLIDLYHRYKKAATAFNAWEVSSRILWFSAKKFNDPIDNLLFTNENEFICEAIETSFGFIYENLVFFPAREANGYYPPLLNIIVKAAKNCGLKAILKKDISSEDLLKADELFLIDNTFGIQKVLGFKNRRYYDTKTSMISLNLNEIARKYIAGLK